MDQLQALQAVLRAFPGTTVVPALMPLVGLHVCTECPDSSTSTVVGTVNGPIHRECWKKKYR